MFGPTLQLLVAAVSATPTLQKQLLLRNIPNHLYLRTIPTTFIKEYTLNLIWVMIIF